MAAELKPEHKVFAENYVFDWNASRSYKVAYPSKKSEETVRANASRLLTNDNVKAYIEEIQEDISKLAGESILKVVNELKKIAYSSLHKYQTDWFTLEEWENVSDDDKTAISGVEKTIRKDRDGESIVVKFKLHDKQKALDSISKMLGFYAPEKKELHIKSEQPLFGPNDIDK